MTLVPAGGAAATTGLWARHWLPLCVLLAIAGFYLWTEHRAHLLGALPWLILLACPLMHFFMHGGHGGHGDDAGHGGPDGHMDHSGHRSGDRTP